MAQVDKMTERSKSLEASYPYVRLAEDLAGGIDTMRAAGKTYLRRFEHESNAEYKNRLENTKMTNIFSDILKSLSDKPFERDVKYAEGTSYSDFMTSFIDNVDGAGNNITDFAKGYFRAGIQSAIDWVFVDNPSVTLTDGQVMTIAEKRKQNIRPFWTRIRASAMLEANVEMRGGNEVLTLLRHLEAGPNGEERVRIYNNTDGVVTWRLLEKTDTFNEKERTAFTKVVAEGVLGINEIPAVPFITGERVGRSYEITNPPLKAAADAQRDLYEQESALKYAKVLAAFPMLSANGVKPQKDEEGKIIPITTGPNRVLYAPADANGQIGNWKYVEPNAQTLVFLSSDIQLAIRELRELGRQPLTAHTQNLTTITTAFSADKGKSSVAVWAGVLRRALEQCLRLTAKWEGEEEADFKLFVFDDFDAYAEDKGLDALNSARDRKDISRTAYLNELKRRNILEERYSAEGDLEELLKEGPSEPTGGEMDDGNEGVF